MTTRYSLGPFRLDADAQILFRGDEPVALGQRAVALLRVLVERPGAPISKDALIEAAWAGLTVEESNLPVQIAALRKIFAEAPGGEGWIETLPRRGYRFVGPVSTDGHDGAAASVPAPISSIAAEAGSLELPNRPSIAVLPFQNMTGDAEQEFFADGMAEDIISALSKLRWFFVIARNSTFAYKGKSPDVRQVSRELGVQYVLEGSVRKAANRVRTSAQLIDGTTGNHIWAERYDREAADIFAVQDEITRSVVGAIEPQLYAAENLRIQNKPPESLDGWGCVIRALSHIARYTKDDDERARQLLRKAIALNPRYAKAYSLLAVVETRTLVFVGDDIDTALTAARQHAEKALALDDQDPWSYYSSGFVEFWGSRYDEAVAWFRRAIELNPNFALAHGLMGAALAWGGQPDAALEHFERAIRMSPQDPFNLYFLHHTAAAHFAAERYAEGVACEERVLRERRSFPSALRMLAACHVSLGQLDKARTTISELLRLNPSSSIKRDAYGYVSFTRAGDQERWVAALRKAGLPD